MAAEHVEARSLTALNALAANPPQYPVKPNETRQDPLTLYISRVPGTRDIILSTARPQLKNVSVTDVANSLYYVHFNTPEDEQIAAAATAEAGSGGEPRKSLDSMSSANQIPRKPVRAAHEPSHLQNKTEAPPSGTPEVITPALTPDTTEKVNPIGERHPHFQEPLPSTTPSGTGGDQAPPLQRHRPPSVIQRKPVNAKAPPQTPGAGEDHPPPPPPHMHLPPRPDEIDSLPLADQEWPRQPALPPRPTGWDHPSYYGDSFAGLAPSPPSKSRTPSPGKGKPFTPFSLTIIRRDPSTGQQWNIGQVASFQLEHPEIFVEDRHIPSPSINIHLEAAGYNKFRGMPMSLANFDIGALRGSLDMMRPGSASSRQVPSINNLTVNNAMEPPAHKAAASHGFERQVKMAYGPSWTANIRNAFRRLDSKDGDLSTSPGKKFGHSRDTSAASAGSYGGDFDGGEAPIITTPGQGLKPRGYMFMSPWDGKCEFRTTSGGRGLQCRHILPGTGGAYNPLVDGGGDGPTSPGGGRSRKGSVARSNIQEISELRFNLPSAELFGKPPADQQHQAHLHEGRERMRDRIFNQMTNKTEDDLDDYEYEYQGYDMTLGKEKAGGGNRGKRAKMGKLIIAEDGLKMLDLVVAANVGIWWCVWERKND